jgi:hypothetical protein
MNITVPTIGSQIRVQTKFGTRIGTVVPNEKWEKADTFCMTGDEHIRIRNIALINVVRLEYVTGAPTQNSVRAFRVKSKTSGGEYTVTVTGDKVECNCVGFQFRHKCKHATAIQEKLNESEKHR